jgi:dienelactone hydrolase
MNRIAIACGAAACFLGCTIVQSHGQTSSQSDVPQSAPSAAAPPQIPTPTGPFGIGRVGFDWIDTTRPDRFSSDPQAHREIMVYLWYPTSKQTARDAYLPGAAKFDGAPEIQRRMRDEYEANWQWIVSGAIFSHVQENAPVIKTPNRFPLVVFSHGLGGSGFEYTALLEDLVSRGYMVAAIEHTETAIAVLFPDGRMIPAHADTPPAGLSAAQRWQRMNDQVGLLITEGTADVRFVLDRLTALDRGDTQNFLLARRLDLDRVAAMGHSAGAEFAARACQLDVRFKACVDLDGGMVPIAALPEYPDDATLKQPLLFLEAYYPESKMGGTHEQHEEYFKKREAQLQACPRGTYAVVLRSAGMMHGSFSDYSLLAAGDRTDETARALHNLDLTETFIRAFLDKALNGKKGTILDNPHPDSSEVNVQAYGH